MKKLFTLALSLAFAAGVSAQSTKYVKVQTEPESWEGTYLIVYELDDENHVANVFDGSLEVLDAKANFFAASNPYQSINGEEVRTIDSSEQVDAATFTVTKSTTVEGSYYIQSKSGYWIGYNSTEPGDDGINPDPNLKYANDKQYDNTIALADGKTNVIVTSVNGFELRFNTDAGKERFRYHASGKKKAIKFYRQETVTEDGTTAISNPAATQQSTAVYNLQGQRVADDFRGVVIKNGKKVMVK